MTWWTEFVAENVAIDGVEAVDYGPYHAELPPGNDEGTQLAPRGSWRLADGNGLLEFPRLQVTVRAKSYASGWATANALHTRWSGVEGHLLTTKQVDFQIARLPSPVGRDEQGQWLFQFFLELTVLN